MAPGIYRSVLISLALTGAGAAALAGFALAQAIAAGAAAPGLLLAIATAGGLVVIGLWLVSLRLKDHVARLERLRGGVLVAAAHDEMLPPQLLAPADDEAGRLANTLAQAIEQQRLRRVDPDTRLAAVVAAAAEGILVVTETGLVSLVNGAALSRLGEDAVVVGTSVYDVLHRSELAEATARTRAAGRPLTTTLTTVDGGTLEVRVADLGEAGGVVISLPRGSGAPAVALRHDLGLHEQPPAAAPPDDGTPLAELGVVVLDTETTGLDVADDRIVSIGAVRMHGARIYRHLTFDRLVDPGRPIPARSTAVHGISTAMVAGAPPVTEVLPHLAGFVAGTVVVGHCVAFDLGMLEVECRRSGHPWSRPPSLDTMLLAGGLFSQTDQLSLDALAERLGVTVRGRHTALGDALVTAEVFARLLVLMREQGIDSLGAARALAARPQRIIAQQRASGWAG